MDLKRIDEVLHRERTAGVWPAAPGTLPDGSWFRATVTGVRTSGGAVRCSIETPVLVITPRRLVEVLRAGYPIRSRERCGVRATTINILGTAAMNSTEGFPAYSNLADALIERASKEQIADVARLLALNIGGYHQRYGDVPQETLLRMVRAETLTEEAQALLLHGMQNLVSALAEVTGLTDDLQDEARH